MNNHYINNNFNYVSLSVLLDSIRCVALLFNYFTFGFAFSRVASVVCYFVINCRSVAQTKNNCEFFKAFTGEFRRQQYFTVIQCFTG